MQSCVRIAPIRCLRASWLLKPRRGGVRKAVGTDLMQELCAKENLPGKLQGKGWRPKEEGENNHRYMHLPGVLQAGHTRGHAGVTSDREAGPQVKMADEYSRQ